MLGFFNQNWKSNHLPLSGLKEISRSLKVLAMASAQILDYFNYSAFPSIPFFFGGVVLEG